MAMFRKLASFLVIASTITAGCTGSGTDGNPPSTDRPPATTESIPPPIQDEYSYSNAGLNARVKFEGSGRATLEIENDTGRTLPKPGLYVEHAATGREINGRVVSSAAIPDGETSTFDVTFPPEVRPDTIGLLILLIGPDNYGAFVPPAAA